jgi:AraC-like DNA-binding protein
MLSGAHTDKTCKLFQNTEMRLLSECNEQEDALFFLEKNVSLNSLALILQSNQRYTSYIIHKYRGKDYYAYIQMKRIEYIVDRLKKDSALLDYKLSHLADISGFSNPSKFSTAFKQKMGIPPSAFVHLLKNDQSSSGS